MKALLKKAFKLMIATFILIVLLIFCISIAYDLLIRHQVREWNAMHFEKTVEFDKAMQLSVTEPLRFPISGCFTTDPEQVSSILVNINSKANLISVSLVTNGALNLLPASVTAKYELTGSLMRFSEINGAEGLLSPYGWIFSKGEGFIKGEFDFFIHSNNTTLFLTKKDC